MNPKQSDFSYKAQQVAHNPTFWTKTRPASTGLTQKSNCPQTQSISCQTKSSGENLTNGTVGVEAEEVQSYQQAYLVALHEIALGLLHRLDLASLLEDTLEQACALACTRHGYVYVLEPAEATMKLTIRVGALKEKLGYQSEIKCGEGLAGKVWQSGQTQLIEDYSRWEGRLEGEDYQILRTSLAIPLKSGDKVVGVIGLAYLEPQQTFSDSMIEMLNRFAQLASIALDNARLYQQAQQELAERRRTEEALLEANQFAQQIISSAGEGIIVYDCEGRHLVYNAFMEKITGLAASEVLGKTAFEILPVVQKWRFAQVFERALTGERTKSADLVYRVPQSGSQGWLVSTHSPYYSSKGEIVGVIAVVSEISECKQVEEALNNSMATNRALLEAMPDLMFRISGNGTFVNYKGAKETDLGIAPDQFLGKTLFEMFPLDIAHSAMQCVTQALSTGLVQSLEYKLTVRDKAKYYETRFATSAKDEVIAIIRDITRRKKAEEALEAERDFAIQVMNSMGQGLVITDRDSHFRYVNMAFTQLLGYPSEELVGKTLFDITPSEDHRIAKQADKQPLNGEVSVTSYETRLIDKEGNLIYVAVTDVPLYYSGGIEGTISVITDLSERKQAEEILRESERRYRLVSDNIKEVIFHINAQGLWTFLNPAWVEITGFSLEESLGQSFLNYVHYEDHQHNAQQLLRLIEGEVEYCQHAIRCRTKAGGYRWIELYARLNLDINGNLLGIFGTLHDITERKQAEEEILKTLAKEQELGQLRTNFVTMVSHEFRTPLTSILSSAELLEHYQHKWSEEKKKEILGRIQTGAKQMTSLLEDVLYLSKAEAGKIEIKPAPLALIPFCYSLVEELEVSSNQNHRINFVYEDGAKEAICLDEKILRHIVLNLLSNALKYSPEDTRVKFELVCQESVIIFKIKDEGIGIPPQELPYLFEPFQRASNTRSLIGTGLGLTIVKKNVELTGGTIEVDSELGRGTTFRVILPIPGWSQPN